MTTLSKRTKVNSPVAQKAVDFYLSQAQIQIENSNSPELATYRKAVAESFAESGFPSRRHENWAYTALTGFLNNHYKIGGTSEITKQQVKSFLPSFDVTHLVFVDGHFSGYFSDDLSELEDGITIEAVKDTLDFVSSYQLLMQHEAMLEQEPFGMLNSMLFDDGLMITLEPYRAIERPILCTHIQTQDSHANTIRNRIALGKGAQMTLIQQYVSLNDSINSFDNTLTEISLDENAIFKQIISQDLSPKSTYFGLQFVEQATKSNYSTHYVGLGAELSRHQNYVYMNGEHIETQQSSSCFATGKQVMDTRTFTDHQNVWGVSNQMHKLVLDGEAQGVFDGMIKVSKPGQKTDGIMHNKNLLLSDTARINTKPRLEIYADDVLCSHSATSGQIDENQIFYLRARGFTEDAARRLITQAFLLEPLETIGSESTQNWLATKLIKKLNA